MDDFLFRLDESKPVGHAETSATHRFAVEREGQKPRQLDLTNSRDAALFRERVAGNSELLGHLQSTQGQLSSEAASIVGELTVQVGGRETMGTGFQIAGGTSSLLGEGLQAGAYRVGVVPGGQAFAGPMLKVGGALSTGGTGLSHYGDYLKGDFDAGSFGIDVLFEGTTEETSRAVQSVRGLGFSQGAADMLDSFQQTGQNAIRRAIQAIYGQDHPDENQ